MYFLQIKNMVCPRCLTSVQDILDQLEISYKNIELGTVEMDNNLSKEKETLLEKHLLEEGFELLRRDNNITVNMIKSIIINKVHHGASETHENLSEELSASLHSSYSHLSNIFKDTQGITIEQFLIKHRIEKVKELLSYEEKTIAEIAYEIGYSS